MTDGLTKNGWNAERSVDSGVSTSDNEDKNDNLVLIWAST